MKSMRKTAALLAASAALAAVSGCASTKSLTKILEDKGMPMGISTPKWVDSYIKGTVSAVQGLPEYKDKYCVIGEASGVNKLLVLAWADSFSAQQQIGVMIRTTISSAYTAKAKGSAQSSGGRNSASAQGSGSGSYEQAIDNSINSIVAAQYSGAQREGDWWTLQRNYDPDKKGLYSDEYKAYVFYTFPKSSLNQQVATALRSNEVLDPDVARVSVEIAEDIVRGGLNLEAR
ncbi:hypothetical protein [Treponema endosymbiont of Eucomonympha sp.]|uniref:hypothetical protein n=1 Tax=Treponema endosymbiont of Eucomonympha sp. TaxID=1580831 RepID=UPI0007513F2C|nr:hypothetical protein [Treponema endosymbiont of Eucomonympha sp.]